jgi:TolA-binding protein
MDDFGDELEEIKREIVESRSLTIKTNNLVNGLSADINSIAKRQQSYERGLKLNSALFYATVVVLVLVGAKIVLDARVDAERAKAKDQLDESAKLEKEVKLLQAREESRVRAERKAIDFWALIQNEKRAEAISAWPEVSKLSLSGTERAIFERTVERFTNELSLLAYQAGLEHIRAGRWQQAEHALSESLQYKSEAPHSAETRYQLARALKTLGRQSEAIVILQQLSEGASNREVMDDATFLLAQSQVDIEAWNDAKSTYRNYVRRFPKSVRKNEARQKLAELQLYH